VKIKLTFKNPDAIDIALSEIDGITDEKKDQARDVLSRWIKYGEYITVEVDTEMGTIIVCEV